MNLCTRQQALISAQVLCVSLLASPAWGQAQGSSSQQVLDRVDAYNKNVVLEMAFDDPNRTQDFVKLGIAGTNFFTCKLTATDGIFCLDGKIVRHWPNPADPSPSHVDVLSCNDPVLKLDTKKPDTCTGMSVDSAGAIWLAGKKASTHSLIKVVAQPVTEPCGNLGSRLSLLSGSGYCWKELYTGRPLLVDIDPIGGDVGAAFKPCQGCGFQSGILGLEERKTSVFFPDSGTSSPIVIASGKGWNLIGNEQLLSSALLQVPDQNSAIQNFVLVTTTSGRILAKRTDVAEAAFQVFNIPLQRTLTSQCDSGTQHYGIRTSSKSGRVYVTDRNFCQVLALVPIGSSTSAFSFLENDSASVGGDLTLSTSSDSLGTFPPSGPTLAPGINVDLNKCSTYCPLLTNEAGTEDAAALVGVQLADPNKSGATLFQVKGIVDCRYADAGVYTVCDNALARGVIVDPDLDDGVDDPASRLLNVTPLLPKEITSLFDTSGIPPKGLPPLLISRQYRAQARNDFVFEAFFVVTEAGVRIVNNYTAEYDVPLLEGVEASLGCEPNTQNFQTLLEWDVVTAVNEVFKTTDVDGIVGPDHVDVLTNVGCRNPTLVKPPPRLSLLPYNLEIAPDTYGHTFDATRPDRLSPDKSVTTGNDAVFARLVQDLYDDLEYVRREMACKAVDTVPAGSAPLSSAVCDLLSSKWQNGKNKLDSCVNAAFQPKESAGNQNCQSFVSQLANFRALLPETTSPTDVANRLGELKSRVDVIQHVFDTRFLPSVPDAGFCKETGC